MKILIIENDPDQSLLFCGALESTDYQPTVVHSDTDSRTTRWEDFGLILLDYQSPDDSELDLISEIRSLTDLPLIVIAREFGLAVEAMKRGASDCMLKTGDYLQTLPFTIAKNLERYRLRQEKARLEQELQRSVQELQHKNEQLQMAHQQLIEAAKLSAVAQLVSGVAHEINNPLTGIIGFAELLQGSVTDDQTRSLLGTVHTLALRCAATIKALAMFARQGKMAKGLVNVNELLRSCLTLNEHNLGKNDIEVVVDLCDQIPSVQAHGGQLQQVFVNIIKNSHQALSQIKRKRVLSITTYYDDDSVFIRFKDNGRGMDAEGQTHVFEPFFTTHQVGEGSGLGLSVSYGIIKEHGGDIALNSMIDEGTEVVISLPNAATQNQENVIVPEARKSASNEIAGGL